MTAKHAAREWLVDELDRCHLVCFRPHVFFVGHSPAACQGAGFAGSEAGFHWSGSPSICSIALRMMMRRRPTRLLVSRPEASKSITVRLLTVRTSQVSGI